MLLSALRYALSARRRTTLMASCREKRGDARMASGYNAMLRPTVKMMRVYARYYSTQDDDSRDDVALAQSRRVVMITLRVTFCCPLLLCATVRVAPCYVTVTP